MLVHKASSRTVKGRLECDFAQSLGQTQSLSFSLVDSNRQQRKTDNSMRGFAFRIQSGCLICLLHGRSQIIPQVEAKLDVSISSGEVVGFGSVLHDLRRHLNNK